MRKARRILLICLVFLIAVNLAGCMQSGGNDSMRNASNDHSNAAAKPEIPAELEVNEDGMPMLAVYDLSIEEVSDMDIETYVMGVVAGEMKNDWPMEALKAQAILARTFVLKFCQDKSSKYDDADISTDVTEAQAYSYENINDRVRQAVEETRGLVMSADGEYPYAWFHAHAGGMTELPSVALDFKGEDPEYLKPTKSEESDQAPDSVKSWSASFTKSEVAQACSDAGVKIQNVESIEIGEKGDSGRAATLKINKQDVSAPSFRIQIGANKLKSTLIDDIKVEGDTITFTGKGYGHGVGMSQWGAYQMAESGSNAEAIVEYYFPGVDIVEMW